MNSKLFRYVATMAFTGIVLVGAFVIAMYGSAAYAAPQAQEIPAVGVAVNAPAFATLYAGKPTTATGATTFSTAFDVTPYDESELNVVIDQTNVNTVSLAFQYSVDRINWTTTEVITANAADANSWFAPAPLGRYMRVKLTPTNANPVTVTVAGVLEP